MSNLTDSDEDFMAAMERIVGDDDEWGRSPTVTLPREVLTRLVEIANGRRGEAVALRRWKAEALPLLELLDRCHALLPFIAQAPLGFSKAEAVENFLMRRKHDSGRSGRAEA